MKRILIVDSDMAVRGQIGRHARLEGYEVAEAGDGYTAVSMCRQNAFDIIILAILLPEMDGFSVCQTIRSFSQVPILMLTERTSEQDRIHGLELGADDYMTKPFSPRELMLRISAILKRGKSLDSLEPQSIERDGIYIDLTARRVHVDGTLVSLTPKEFDLLALLASHPDVVFSRKKLLDTVWGGELPEDTRTLDTHIKQVRHAISPYSDRIVTLRGVGYRFEKTQSFPTPSTNRLPRTALKPLQHKGFKAVLFFSFFFCLPNVYHINFFNPILSFYWIFYLDIKQFYICKGRYAFLYLVANFL